MHYTRALLLIILIIIPTFVFALSIDIPLDHTKFITYYQEPVTSQSPAIIAVVFYKIKPAPKQIKEFLWNAITMATITEPKHDIVASAFFSNTGKEEDEVILTFENTTALLYTASNKTTQAMH